MTPEEREKLIEDASRAIVLHFRSENKNMNEATLRAATGLFKDAAEAALQGRRPMGEWQPIATAPRDGAVIFLWVPGESLYPTAGAFNSREYFEKNYGDPDYMDEGWYWAFGYPSDFHEETIDPTHWQPIPAPPPEP